MSLRTATIICLLLGFVTSISAQEKKTAKVTPLNNATWQELILAPTLSSADTCLVDNNDSITTRIDGWVIGFELYKSLLDPTVTCPAPYPFTITGVNMPMMFDAGTNMVVSVDIEAVDSTTIPGCPVPGPLLSISTEWQLTIPQAGFYHIWVPLDSPVVVNEPFFAGFYIGNQIPTAVGAAVVIDQNPISCVTYNIWSDSIGWIDLVNNPYYNFPGRLAMEVSGIPGGNGGGSDPGQVEIDFLSPINSDVVFGTKELWVHDTANSGMIDHMIFQYSTGSNFIEIGRDFDGDSPLRDGIGSSVPGSGFSVEWNATLLPEGNYTLRAISVDISGAMDTTTVSVYLDPTPPTANFVSPVNGAPVCGFMLVQLNSLDENLSYAELYSHAAQLNYSVGMTPLKQSTVGDANGNPFDGNPASGGEFGDYYSGPVAATMAVRLWSDRGYPSVMLKGASILTMKEVAEELGTAFNTRENLGTHDEDLMNGLREYTNQHGGNFTLDYKRNPDYFNLRSWVEDDERTVILGIGGSPSVWVTVDGFQGWMMTDSTFMVSILNPITGIRQYATWRNRSGYSEIAFAGSWQRVDIMISLFADNWGVTRKLEAVDFTPLDGLTLPWDADTLTTGAITFLRSSSLDNTFYRSDVTIIVESNCSSVYIPGDYNDDRLVSIADLFTLVQYITQNGPPPNGGPERADSNCDNIINVADIIYYMNFLYGSASPPCR